ncbi:type III-A CRISPR-associated protein Csm2 [Oscillochloris sp. ZM17-4]|uniref:type III-A CRISPR-associated protein Csm2 n=1 Tax=Oscillochloris sp. ZM17-4 TaxID=2866714 RepID=UPI001C73DAE5|nr:type III-A CRISPR-associated protein Csm2 [Oscillochloris sp. ZM17-4]MBX0330703.1 type III-A CRISPR-associated protein Csm2 [Oscillochloris sp. ZM17-4]
MALLSEPDIKAIIEDGNNEKLVSCASNVGSNLARQLTTSQIRGIFGSVRRIELDWQDPSKAERVRRAEREFALLQPRLAYQARRERGRGVEELRQVLDPAMRYVGNDYERFRNFVDFFEAILAYHKANGGQ